MMAEEQDRFEQALWQAARDYNRPPEVPREEMWARIEAARRGGGAGRASTLPRRRSNWVRWGLGLAAALAIGIGIGRYTLSGERGARSVADGTSVSDVRDAGGTSLAYRVAATEHLSRAEALLTAFRTRDRSGEPGREFTAAAADLLSSTRLMLDSPAADDPIFRALLEDLELVLAAMVQRGTAGDGETGIIDEGLERRGLLQRLRSAIPAGPVGS